MWESLPYTDTIAQSEIDIFEARGVDNSLGPNVHFAQTTGAPQYDLYYSGGLPMPLLTPDFSDYRRISVEWTSEYIKFFLDDSLFAVNIEHSGDLTNMPFLLNMGHPALNYCDSVDTVNTQYPWEWKIDYIRIYQLRQRCSTDTVINTLNLATYLPAVYKTISIGGSGYSSTISSGNKVFLRATDGITINGEFTVNLGAELTILPTTCDGYENVNNEWFSKYPSPPPEEWLERKGY